MRPGEQLILEVRVDARSFEISERNSGTIIMSVRSGGGLPLDVFSHLRDTLNGIITDYLARQFAQP